MREKGEPFDIADFASFSVIRNMGLDPGFCHAVWREKPCLHIVVKTGPLARGRVAARSKPVIL